MNQEQMTCEVFSVWGFDEKNTFEDFVEIIWINEGSKSKF